MIYPYGSLFSPPPFPDKSVDIETNEDGRVDEFSILTLDIPEQALITNLNQRIDDSKAYWEEQQGFNLSSVRNENLRMYLGEQVDAHDYYKHETPYVENQIEPLVDSIVSYSTARTPQSEVYPSDNNDRAKKFALDLERAHSAHSLKMKLRNLIEICVRNWELKRAAYIKLEFDPSYGKKGEIVPKAIDPMHIVWDKNAVYGENPGFVTQFIKYTVEELVFLFPKKRKEIFKALGIQRRGTRNMTYEIIIKQTWFTHYDKGEPQEACAIHFENIMLEMYDDPNWLKDRENFLDAPMKPFISLNVINDGNHGIDFTTPVEQAIKMQRILNRRGQQISVNADKANGTKIINAKSSGMTKDAAQILDSRPNQTILFNPREQNSSQPPESFISTLPAHDLPDFVLNDKTDARQQIGNIGSAPSDFSSADSEGDDEALGQSMLKKDNATGRLDILVRALDTFMYDYFNLLTQMMFVWYDTDHFFNYNGSDGEWDRLIIHRKYFKLISLVSVKAGGTIAFDKNRRQAVVLKLLDMDKFPLLSAYRELGFENPQKIYDEYVKQNADPQSLAREANDTVSDTRAYIEFDEIMDGKKPKLKYDVDKEFILTLRKLMLTDEFINAKSKPQNAFIKRINEYIKSLELRTSLDQVSQSQGAQGLNPNIAIPPPQPPQSPQGMPPGQPMPGQPPMPQGQPQGAPMTPPTAGSIFQNSPIPNQAAPQTPTAPTSLPAF